MSMDENQFIENLADDLKPGRFWSPMKRSMGFLLVLLATNFGILLFEQGFRPGFLSEILAHPRFLIELLSASALIVCSIYYVFSSFVPGMKVSPAIKYGGLFSLLLFGISIYLSFGDFGPNSTFSGARMDCRQEVFIYSIIGLISFAYFAWTSPYPTHHFGYLYMGLASAVVPGTIMQVACMYSPMHSLDHHYGPALAVALVVGLVFPFLKSRRVS